MATRKVGTIAAVNRAIDAIIKQNPSKTKAQTIADVRRFCREHGLTISPKAGNEPLIGKGDWLKVFDSWADAYDYFQGWKYKKIDHNLPYPWDAKKNPAKKPASGRRVALVAMNPARKKTVPYRNEAKANKKDDPAWIGYAVHRVGSKSSAYAILQSKSDAVEYARKMADLKGWQMGVTRIKYNVAQS